jgi:hypothetical protein
MYWAKQGDSPREQPSCGRLHLSSCIAVRSDDITVRQCRISPQGCDEIREALFAANASKGKKPPAHSLRG